MFDGAGNDMLFMATRSFNDAEDGVIVGLRATAGEDNFVWARADKRCDLFASSLYGGAGFLSRGVDGGSVGKFAGEIGKHGVEHGGLDGRGGVKIEIDAGGVATESVIKAGRVDMT